MSKTTNPLKTACALCLSAVMLFAGVPAASASAIGNATAGSQTDDAATLEQEAQAPTGYALDGATPSESTETSGGFSTLSVTTLATTSGTCAGVNWSLDGGVLTISGTKMQDLSKYTEYAWYEHRSDVTSIVVNSGVENIAEGAFCYMPKVTSVTLPTTVTKISDGAFAYCYSLTSVTGTDNLIALGDYAFQGAQLTSFTIGRLMTSFSTYALFGCPIESISVDSGNDTYKTDGAAVLSKNGKTLLYFSKARTGAYTVPSTVTKIDEGAFQGAALTSVTVPSSVTEIGYFAFYECEKLVSASLGSGLKTLGYEAFMGCSALKNVDIAAGKTKLEIDGLNFAYCTSLTSITLPDRVTSIGNGCFGECPSLVSFTAKGIDCIPYQTFFKCGRLSKLTLGNKLTAVYRQSFYNCVSLKSIKLPSSVTYVADGAFPTSTKVTGMHKGMSKFGTNGWRLVATVKVKGTYNYKNAFKVLTLVNKERAKKKLAKLSMSKSLLATAMQRAAELNVRFSHTRPDGEDCFEANDLMSGENVAWGQSSAKSVMTSWMNSSGHKANILGSSYKSIGIGCFVDSNGGMHWVQCFSGSLDKAVKSSAYRAKKKVTPSVALKVGKYTDDTDGKSIKYKLAVSVTKKLKKGKKATAKVYVRSGQRRGWSYEQAVLVNSSLKWSSSNKKVATVSKKGKVKAKKKGKTTITVKTKNGLIVKKFKVKVK